jgi:hypothetical protein
MRVNGWRRFVSAFRCFVGLHSWEPPFRYVYGPFVTRLEPLSEGGPYLPFGFTYMPRRKERIVMQHGQMRCSLCLAFKLPNTTVHGRQHAAGGNA